MSSRTPESYLHDVLDGTEKSLLDVGSGHSGVFDFWFWEEKSPESKGMVDINTFREDTPKSWFRVKADARNLPFRDSCFDVVSSTEMLEHVPSDGWQKVLDELYRVSKNLVYITTSDYTHHLGEEQKRIEQLNPFQKYQDFPKEELFVTNGFHILFASQDHMIAFKRKIPEWNSCFKDMETYVRQVCGNMQITSVMDVGTGLKAWWHKIFGKNA